MRTHSGRSITIVVALFLASLATFAATAQMRGKGRLQGSVVDKATGKPIAGATVTISGNDTKPIVTKTNAKGQWSALGLISGAWDIDVEAKGYQTLRGSASISEMQMAPPIRSELAAAVEAEVPVEAGPTNVPESVISAVNDAPELLSRSAGDPVSESDATPLTAEMVKSNSGKAAALLEKLPDWAVSDPTVYLNVGILFMNKESAKDAITYFDKAIALDASKAESYYYRGLAHMQTSNTAAAKTDFQKVIELAPDGPEAGEAKQLLAGLK